MKPALVLAVSIAFLGAATTQGAPTVQSVEITEYGIYLIHHLPPSFTAATAVEPATQVHLIAATNTIPAVVGTTFGCRFRVKGEPDEVPVNLEIVVKHPPFPRRQGLPVPADRVPYSAVIGRDGVYTYTFDNAWQAVPGKWSIQVWHDDSKLAEQNFVAQPKRP